VGPVRPFPLFRISATSVGVACVYLFSVVSGLIDGQRLKNQ
jgi:hypothetical protein